MKQKDQKEYKNILNNTVIPSTLPEEDVLLLLDPLKRFLETHLPKRLYKYRSCNERNFDSLLYGRIWFSTPESMNDSFDSRCFFDKTTIRQMMLGKLPMDIAAFSKKIYESGESINLLFSRYPEIQSEYERIRKLPKEAIEEKIESLRKRYNVPGL